jgi:hypothetical protein
VCRYISLQIILIALANMSSAIQKLVYSPLSTDENGNGEDDSDYIGQEINKLMDDMMPDRSLLDKRKEAVYTDPCQCPYKNVEIYISNLTNPSYQKGRICDNKTIEMKQSNKRCGYGTTCKTYYYQMRYQSMRTFISIPIDCRCMN